MNGENLNYNACIWHLIMRIPIKSIRY